jgi:hypothetical protein
LLRASIGSAVLVTGSLVAGVMFRRDSVVTSADRLAALFPAASLAAIGHAYLATRPDVADLAGVLAALGEKIPALEGSETPSDQGLRHLLDARTRADFRVGDVVHVNGWVLARTEALLCGYVALTRDRAA